MLAGATVACLFLVQIFVQTSSYARTYHTPKNMLFHFWIIVSVKRSLSLSLVLITRYDDFKFNVSLFTMNWSVYHSLVSSLMSDWFWVHNGSTSGWNLKEHIVHIALLSSVRYVNTCSDGTTSVHPQPPSSKSVDFRLSLYSRTSYNGLREALAALYMAILLASRQCTAYKLLSSYDVYRLHIKAELTWCSVFDSAF